MDGHSAGDAVVVRLAELCSDSLPLRQASGAGQAAVIRVKLAHSTLSSPERGAEELADARQHKHCVQRERRRNNLQAVDLQEGADLVGSEARGAGEHFFHGVGGG